MKLQLPEDLTVLSAADLEKLRVDGLAEFDEHYREDFATIPAESRAELALLTPALKAIKAELARRDAEAAAFADAAATREEFAKVTGTFEGETEDAESEEPDGDETITAAADRPNDAPAFSAGAVAEGAEPVVAIARAQDLGVLPGAKLTFAEVGEALEKRIADFNVQPYRDAASRNQVLKRTDAFASFTRDLPEELMIRDGDNRGKLRKVIAAARDVKRLGGHKALIASGGWGAPSQISYDRFGKLSSRDGIASFPEIGVERGGLQIPHGSTFASVFANADFISFNEQQDIDGEYALGSGDNLDGTNIEGTKPIYRIPPTTWVDYRLRVDGAHIQAGILENRGYPEGIVEEVAQVLDVHAHVINAKVIATAVAGSTAVTMPTGQVGAVAPLLTTIELQAEHYRDTHRMLFGEALEVKMPFWVRGALRADLARRLGVDLIAVSDQRINAWFADLNVSVEWVYDWQSIATTAVASFNAYPTTVSFLLYAAGTWVKGVSDVIKLDTMYDSTLIGTNDYTVMFTEEGWFLAKAGPDSRVVTVELNPTGATHIGDEIARNGTAA